MPRLPVTAIACLALAAGGAVAGCGDDETDTSSTPSRTTAEAAPEADSSSESSGKIVQVGMKAIKFVPDAVTAKIGQKVVWTNTDGQIPHNVTATEGADFESGNMNAGDKFDYTPTKAGKIAYVCTIHSGQNGSITVTK